MSNEINEYPPPLWEEIPQDLKIVFWGAFLIITTHLPLALLVNSWDYYYYVVDYTIVIVVIYLFLRVVYKSTWEKRLKGIKLLVELTASMIIAIIFARNYSGEYVMIIHPFTGMNEAMVEWLAMTQVKIVELMGEERVKEVGRVAVGITVLYLIYNLTNLIIRKMTSSDEYRGKSIRVTHSIIEPIASGVMMVVVWSGLTWINNSFFPRTDPVEETITSEDIRALTLFLLAVLVIPIIYVRLTILEEKIKGKMRRDETGDSSKG